MNKDKKIISKQRILLLVFYLLNFSLVLFYIKFFNIYIASFSLLLLVCLNIILIARFNLSTPIFGNFFQKQYFRTKFRLLNNLDQKKSLKKNTIIKINKLYLKALSSLVIITKNQEEGYQIVREDIYKTKDLESLKVSVKDARRIFDAIEVVNRVESKKDLEWNELEILDQVLKDLYKQKHQSFTKFSSITLVTLILATSSVSLITTLLLPQISQIKAATYGWVQTDWSGGSDEASTANHQDNQTGWTKVFSKDASVDITTPGELSLASSQIAITDTEDADFSNTTMTNNSGGFYIANGTIQLKKQSGAPCSYEGECKVSCHDGVCIKFKIGVCSGIGVYESDMPGKYPYSAYGVTTASGVCSTIGARVPSRSELQCIAQNADKFGGNFVSSNYWTKDSYPYNNEAYTILFPTGASVRKNRSAYYYVRCVKSF